MIDEEGGGIGNLDRLKVFKSGIIGFFIHGPLTNLWFVNLDKFVDKI
jgi:hypothetical protein